jgi:broad specificity phosphatase PhoE
VSTTIYLVRHGVTDWHQEGRLLGHRDLGLSAAGRDQAAALARALTPLPVAEVISSPLVRALETAEAIASPRGIPTSRDRRIIDFQLGRWEGMTYAEIAASAEYQQFLRDPATEAIPGGERLAAVRDRAVSALEQALADSPESGAIVMVTHAGVIRLLLTHVLGAPLSSYHRLRVAPGSISILRWGDERTHERGAPRVLAMNWNAQLGEALPG